MFGSMVGTSITISVGALFVVVALALEHLYLSRRKRERN
jgi:ABC-type Fe3+ transport system permease subunit